MEHEVSRTIRIIQESAGNRTTVQETIRVLQAFRDTERTIREAEMSRTTDSSTRIIRAAEQRTSATRTEDEISRIVRIIRETSGSRTEAETSERILRTAERSTSILREAETERTSDSVTRIIRAAEQRTSATRTEDEISRIVRIIRETSGSRTEAETSERILRTAERNASILREAETERMSDRALRVIRSAEERAHSSLREDKITKAFRILRGTDSRQSVLESGYRIIKASENQSRLVRELERERSIDETFRTAQSRNEKTESQFSSVASILRILGGGTGNAETQTALRILREREYAERERRQRETYQYDAAAREATPNIESYRAYRGGSPGNDGGNVTVNLSVEYNIDGVSDTEQLRKALRSNDRELVALIKRAAREAYQEDRENRARRAFV